MEAIDIATNNEGKVVPLVLLSQAIGVLLNFPPDCGWIFRGEVDSSWPLIPKAGRAPFFESCRPPFEDKPVSKDNPPRDLGRFNHWRMLASAYVRDLPENDFECLAYAQHYGLPTRLQDWTENALVALYFATERDFDKDGAVYAFFPETFVKPDHANLYTFPKVACLRVRPFDRRLLAQHARFVYYPDPSVPLKPGPMPLPEDLRVPRNVQQNLLKIRISKQGKLMIHRQLRDIGMTRRTLFPDLEGLSQSFVAEDVYQAAFDAAQAAKEAANKSAS